MPVVLPKRPHLSLARTPLASAVLLALASPSLMAQDTSTLGEVIVTAQKREQSLQDVPISIKALDSQTLDELNIQNFKDYVQFLPTRDDGGHRRCGFRLQRGLHARRRDRRRRTGDDLAAERRHVPRRAADHHHPGQPRRAPVRHRARRGARRPAGHAVRRELAGGHDPHHHQQAGSVRLRGELCARGQLRRHGRARLRRGRHGQPADRRDCRHPARRLGRSHDAGLDRQRRAARGSVRGRSDDRYRRRLRRGQLREFAEDNYNTIDTVGARAQLRINLGENWTVTPSLMYQKMDQEGSWADDLSDGPAGTRPATRRSRITAQEWVDDEWYQLGPDGRGIDRATSTSSIPATILDRESGRAVRLFRVFLLVQLVHGYVREPISSTTPAIRSRSRIMRSTTTTITRRRATSCGSARRRTTACAACSASSTRSRSTTFTRSSAGSRASPTVRVPNGKDPNAHARVPRRRVPEQHGPRGHGPGGVRAPSRSTSPTRSSSRWARAISSRR